MLDGPSIVAALADCGITHVIWIPDSELGTWNAALSPRRTAGADPRSAGRGKRSRWRRACIWAARSRSC